MNENENTDPPRGTIVQVEILISVPECVKTRNAWRWSSLTTSNVL
jgi:hypothetical protein